MFKWHDVYLIGNERIDMQHRIFLGLIQEFNEARLAYASLDKLRGIIEELIKFAEFHFISEENIMQDLNYPKFDEHRKQHHRLLDDIAIEFSGWKLGVVSSNRVERFLFDWFSNHTAEFDKDLADTISSKLHHQEALIAY